MIPDFQRLTRLSSDAEAQIRSAGQISSLHDVVIELVKNSLDANAKNIRIRLDFSRGHCSILDDGDGILGDEFSKDGKLTQPYYTSRDLHSESHYGKFGRFLSSLCGVSVLSISSRHVLEGTSNSAVFKDGKCIAVSADKESLEVAHGTKVVVHDLFGKIPVRVKYRATKLSSQPLHKEFGDLKKSLVGLILAATRSFSLELTDPAHRYKHNPRWADDTRFDLNRIASIFHQAGMAESPNPTGWEKASVHTPDFGLDAAIYLEPVATKSKQFISLNQHCLSSHLSVFIDQVNAVFETSTFGMVTAREATTGQDYDFATTKESHRWPMFWICISLKCLDVESAMHTQINALTTSICGVLRTLIAEFLQCHGFTNFVKPKTKPRTKQALYGPCGLDSWSRIKSTNYGPRAFLTGLPFIAPNLAPKILNIPLSPNFEPPLFDCSHPNLSPIKWTSPRTGQTLSINPTNGMTIPSRSSISQRRCQTKQLSEVVSAFGDSTSTVVDPGKVLGDNDHVCKFEYGSSIHMGPLGQKSITKESLKTVSVLGQTDKKFILASLQGLDGDTTLIAIDQHAADERVKFEQLLAKNQNVTLTSPIIFQVDEEETQMFQRLQDYFFALGIQYTINLTTVKVSSLPESIVERCRLQPKLIVELLRKEIWQDHQKVNINSHDHWLSRVGIYPQSILDMLASRACRSAVMFNDSLTQLQCQELIRQLCDCFFPFQCAHGRPSLTVLAQIQSSNRTQKSFGESWRAWNL